MVNDKTDAGKPPPETDAAATTATTPHNLAVRNLYLGDQDTAPAFTKDANAWETFGYNIDGLITTALSTDVCTLDTSDDATTADQVDGTNGIDNAFGNIIINQILASFNLISSQSVSGDITAGKFTLMFDTVGLDGTATQNASGLTGQLFAGSTYNGTPALNTGGTSFAITDDWPVNGSLLVDPTDITKGSAVQFSSAYVSGGTWVSGKPVDIALTLTLSGISLDLTIRSGVVTMPITVDTAGQYHTTKGIVSGVIETTQFVNAINTLGAKLGYCSIISTILPELKAAQDIIITEGAGGTATVSNVKGTACNGISIGLAFDGDEIAQPDTIAPATDAGAAVAPCGSGSGSGS
jgi:hypothetical protein